MDMARDLRWVDHEVSARVNDSEVSFEPLTEAGHVRKRTCNGWNGDLKNSDLQQNLVKHMYSAV